MPGLSSFACRWASRPRVNPRYPAVGCRLAGLWPILTRGELDAYRPLSLDSNLADMEALHTPPRHTCRARGVRRSVLLPRPLPSAPIGRVRADAVALNRPTVKMIPAFCPGSYRRPSDGHRPCKLQYAGKERSSRVGDALPGNADESSPTHGPAWTSLDGRGTVHFLERGTSQERERRWIPRPFIHNSTAS